jgi:hypothetical protein
MSLLSSDIFKFTQFLSLSLNKMKTLYKSKLELTEWDTIVDEENISIIKNEIKIIYKNDYDFLNDIHKLAMHEKNDLYRTILKILDLLDLNESKLDNAISKIFLGTPQFNDCGEDS